MKKVYVFVAVIVLFSLALTACGGGGGSSDGDDAVQRGKDLFAQSVIGTEAGCSTCHSLEAGVTIVGPSLAGIGTTAATMVSGMNAEEYLRQSILEPDAYVTEGFPAGTMPQVWKDVLTEDQVNDLVAYLLSLK